MIVLLKRLKLLKVLLYAIIILINSNVALSKSKNADYLKYEEKKFFFSMSYGLSNNSSSTFLTGGINFDRIVSQLDWTTNMAHILAFNIGYKPTEKLTLQLCLDFNIFRISGKNVFDDQDWGDWSDKQASHRTHWSHHTLLSFRYVNVDASLKYELFTIGKIEKYGKLTIGAMVGFTYNYTKWIKLGIGGHFEYPYEEWKDWYNKGAIGQYGYPVKITDDEEVDDEIRALHFTIHRYLPYYGIYIDYKLMRFSIGGSFKHSFANYLSTEDQHRPKGYIEKGGLNSYTMFHYFDISANIGVILTQHIKIFSEFTMRILKYNMSTPERYMQYGEYGTIVENTAYQAEAIKSKSYILKLGLEFAF